MLWLKAESAKVDLRDTNEELRVALAKTNATKLAMDARQQVDEDPLRALLLAVRAVEITEIEGMGVLPEAAEALNDLLKRVGGYDVSPRGPHDNLQNNGFISRGNEFDLPSRISPDGRWLLNLDHSDPRRDGSAVSVSMFDLRRANPRERVRSWKLWDDLDGAQTLRWLNDSKRIVSASRSGEIRLWEPFTDEGDGAPPSRVLGSVVRQGRLSRGMKLEIADGGVSGIALDVSEEYQTVPGVAMVRRFHWQDLPAGGALQLGPIHKLPDEIGPEAIYYFSPDLRWMVAFGTTRCRQVTLSYLGDLDEAPLTAVLREPADNSWHFEFSPDSKRLVFRAGRGDARHYDLSIPNPTLAAASGAFLDHENGLVECFAFSPDSESVAMIGGAPRVTVLSLKPPYERTMVRVPNDQTHVVRFSDDGKWLAAGGSNGVLTAWPVADLARGPKPTHFRGLPSPVVNLVFARDGRSLVAAGMHGVYRYWPCGGHSLGANPKILGDVDDLVLDLDVSPDRKWFAMACEGSGGEGSGGFVKLLDVESNTEYVLGAHGPTASGVAFSPGGRWLASTGLDGTAKLWDLFAWETAISTGGEKPGPAYTFDMTDTRLEYRRRVAFHPRGSLYCTSGDGILFEWDLNEIDPPSTRREHELHTIRYLLPDLEISADGRYLALGRHGWDSEPVEGSGQVGNMVLLFDVSAPGPPEPIAELPANFLADTHIKFSPDGRWLAAGSSGTGPTVWDLEAEDIAASRQESDLMAHRIEGIAFSLDSKSLAMGDSEGRVHLWNWRDGRRARAIGTEHWVTSIVWLDSSRFASTGRGGGVEIWETSVAKLKQMARDVAGREFSVGERVRFRLDGNLPVTD